MKVPFVLFGLSLLFLFNEDVDCLFLSLERRQHMFMNMNKEWQNRQEKHIPPESQSSLESLNTNNKTERKSRSNKEALNLHFRITGWMSKVSIVDVLNFCKYYKKIFIIYVIHCNIVRNIVVYLWLINQPTLSRVYITALHLWGWLSHVTQY